MEAIFEVKLGKKMEIPDAIVDILEEFHDVMPLELLKTLPQRRAVDYKIELESGAKPLARALYRMSH